MSELEYYRILLNKLLTISNKMNTISPDYEQLKKNLTDGLMVNDKIYKEDIINNCLNDIISEKEKLNNVIIPSIRNKIHSLEESEAIV